MEWLEDENIRNESRRETGSGDVGQYQGKLSMMADCGFI